MSVLEAEIVTHSVEEVILGLVVLSLMDEPIVQFGRLVISVERGESLIYDEGWVVTQSIEVETRWRRVVVVEGVGKDLRIFTKSFPGWSPNPFHLLISKTSILVLMVETGEEKGIKAHFSHKSGVGVGVTEWVDLPTDGWLGTELLESEFVTHLHVVDHIFVVWASLIVHGPASIKDFETTSLNKHADILLHLIILIAPPHLEEFHLDVGETLILILHELWDNLIKDKHNLDALFVLLNARKVLIDSFKPANIVVSVSSQVHSQFLLPHGVFLEAPLVLLTVFQKCGVRGMVS